MVRCWRTLTMPAAGVNLRGKHREHGVSVPPLFIGNRNCINMGHRDVLPELLNLTLLNLNLER